jgi:hypothetical protein
VVRCAKSRTLSHQKKEKYPVFSQFNFPAPMAAYSFVVPEGCDVTSGCPLHKLSCDELEGCLGYLNSCFQTGVYRDECNPYGDHVFHAPASSRATVMEYLPEGHPAKAAAWWDAYPKTGTIEQRLEYVFENGDAVQSVANALLIFGVSPLKEYMSTWAAHPEAVRAARKYIALYHPCAKCNTVTTTEGVVDTEDDTVDYMTMFSTSRVPLAYCATCAPL